MKMISPDRGVPKWKELYNSAGRFNKNNKEDRGQDEVELERKPDEYTF